MNNTFATQLTADHFEWGADIVTFNKQKIYGWSCNGSRWSDC